MDRAENADSRQEFLDAGAALLAEVAAETAMRSITVRRLSRRTGKSSGAFYHYWETQADYVADLVRYLAEPDAVIGTDPITAAVRGTAERGPTHSAAELVAIFDFAVDTQVNSEAMRHQMMLWATNDSDSLDALGKLYREYQSEYASMYAQLFAGTGVELVEDVTFEDLALLLTAAVDGMSIRRRIDPDGADRDAAERMVASLLIGLFRRGRDSRAESPFDRLAELFDGGGAG